LNLVGWPREALPFELLGEVLRGGADVARAAGAFVLGGHSVDDPEPKCGMVAIGEVHPDRIVRNSGAKPGDVLVLTKPLGTRLLLADSQTSGGLLIAVAAERADALVTALRREATPAAALIGRVVTGTPGAIAVV